MANKAELTRQVAVFREKLLAAGDDERLRAVVAFDAMTFLMVELIDEVDTVVENIASQ